MAHNYEHELRVSEELAYEAGILMCEYFDRDQEVELKEDGSPVTIADISINRAVIARIEQEFPEDGVAGEEASTEKVDQPRVWRVDPIDGTNPFTYGLPTSMFSLGLDIEGSPIVGTAYSPFSDRMFTAVKGHGATRNGELLQVNRDGLSAAKIAITTSVSRLVDDTPRHVRELLDMGKKNDIVVFGGAVYKACLVAEGKLGAYIQGGVNAHDMAAVQVIVEEAGGRVTGLSGEPLDYRSGFKGAIVSNGIIHDELVELV